MVLLIQLVAYFTSFTVSKTTFGSHDYNRKSGETKTSFGNCILSVISFSNM